MVLNSAEITFSSRSTGPMRNWFLTTEQFNMFILLKTCPLMGSLFVESIPAFCYQRQQPDRVTLFIYSSVLINM